MTIDLFDSAGKWKFAPEIVLVVDILFVMGLGIAISQSMRKTDHRLIGTWQSDVDRTIIQLLGPPPYDPVREAKLRSIYGRMRITYTPTTWTSEFDGTVDTASYEVLGSDNVSVVIRDLQGKPSPLDLLELSSFRIIRFEGGDFYQVNGEQVGSGEIFKRIK